MRSKADAIDYKYFPEPNIPPYEITSAWINEIKSSIPILPLERKNTYMTKYNLNDYDASIIIKNKAISDYYEECLKLNINPKIAANWVITQIIGSLNELDININDFYLTPNLLKQITDAIEKNIISSKQAKEIYQKSIDEQKEPKNFISIENSQITDETALQEIITNILNNNQTQIEQYKNGKTNLFDYFVGQVMKETKGKANPTLTKEILQKELNK